MNQGLRPGLRRGLLGKRNDPYLRQSVFNAFGGSGLVYDNNFNFLSQLGANSPIPGHNTRALSSAYTFGSAGACAGWRFTPPWDDILTDVYITMTAKTGTPGNLLFELRNVNNSTTPGSTLYTSDSVSPTGVSTFTWLRWQLTTPQAVSRNVPMVACCGDAAGSGSNFCTVSLRNNVVQSNALAIVSLETTNGWTTGTRGTTTAFAVFGFASGRSIGNPITGIGATSSTTTRRGIVITGITSPLLVTGVAINGTFGSSDAAEIFAWNVLPGGPPLLREAATSALATSNDKVLFFKNPLVLLPGNKYRAVISSVSSTSPGGVIGHQTNATSYPHVMKCGIGGGKIYGTSQSGTGWADSLTQAYTLALLVREYRMR